MLMRQVSASLLSTRLPHHLLRHYGLLRGACFFPDNWFLHHFLHDRLHILLFNDGFCHFLMDLRRHLDVVDDLLMRLLNHRLVQLMNDFLVLLVDDWLMDLTDLLCVNYWLVVLVNHWHMVLMNNVLMVLMDHLLVVLMYYILMMLFYNWLFNVSLDPGCRSVLLDQCFCLMRL